MGDNQGSGKKPDMHWISITLALTALAPTQTWYVDGSRSTTGDGSQAAPFLTIGEATAVAGPSDTVMVLPGEYAEQIETVARFMIAPGGPDQTTLIAAADGPVICTSREDLFLDGFSIVGSPLYDTVGIDASGSLAFYEVHNCIIRGHERAVGQYSGGLNLWYSTVAGNDVTYLQDDINDLIQGTCSIITGGPVQVTTFGIFNSCLLDQSVSGSNNLIGLDPGFWNAPADLHLAPGSVCIGACFSGDIGALPFDPIYVPGPITFCTSKTSSAGCIPSIGFGGGPAGAGVGGPFLVRANGVDELKNGHLFFGLAPGPFPFLGGWHCIQPPTQRTPIQNSGTAGGPCSGGYAFDFNAFVQGGGTPHVVPGTMVTAQYWYRDPGDPFGSMLTDAIEFGYGL